MALYMLFFKKSSLEETLGTPLPGIGSGPRFLTAGNDRFLFSVFKTAGTLLQRPKPVQETRIHFSCPYQLRIRQKRMPEGIQQRYAFHLRHKLPLRHRSAQYKRALCFGLHIVRRKIHVNHLAVTLALGPRGRPIRLVPPKTRTHPAVHSIDLDIERVACGAVSAQ